MTVQPYVMEKIRASFDFIDADGDHVITEDDHILQGKRVAAALGHPEGSAEERRIIDAYLRIWKELHLPMDTDGDGKVDMDEFIAATSKLSEDPAMAERLIGNLTDSFFAIADRDGDGGIDPAEYAAFMAGHAPGMPSAEVAEAFRHLDIDGDGQITREELHRANVEYFTSNDPTVPGSWAFGRPTAAA
ncbi:EF-hand domain-containing protein [Streptomyces sp. NPDC046909]|uniref:EF-hand domain-containing protein n=1 Tax=Streptomyces sp. NPDC046909 TaxID=3155617 RepID=UPI003404D588